VHGRREKKGGGKWEKWEKRITHHTQYFAMISKLKKHAEVEAYTNGAGPGVKGYRMGKFKPLSPMVFSKVFPTLSSKPRVRVTTETTQFGQSIKTNQTSISFGLFLF